MSSVPNPGVDSGDPAVLLLTGDAGLVAQVGRLAAASGAAVQVLAGPAEARSAWAGAPVVLVGPDVLPSLADTTPTRRPGVHVVAEGTVPEGLFRAALAVGAETVLELPAAETWLVETLADTVDGSVEGGTVVGVVGGCGGAGATTFAAALAAAAADSLPHASDVRPVVLVDADPLGPGIEHVAGLDDLVGAGWGSLLESAGRLGSRSLLAALPRRDQLAVLGWGRDAKVDLDRDVVREVVSAASRGGALVVLDLPRYADPATEELLLGCNDVFLVTTLTLPAVAAAARVAARVLPIVPSGHLVARGPVAGLDPEEVAEALGVPLVAVMSDQRRLAESVELGLGPLRSRRGPLARAARAALGVVA